MGYVSANNILHGFKKCKLIFIGLNSILDKGLYISNAAISAINSEDHFTCEISLLPQVFLHHITDLGFAFRDLLLSTHYFHSVPISSAGFVPDLPFFFALPGSGVLSRFPFTPGAGVLNRCGTISVRSRPLSSTVS